MPATYEEVRSRGRRPSATIDAAPTIPPRAVEVAPASTPTSQTVAVAALLVIAAWVWCFWSTWIGLVKDWRSDPDYSVGMLVPVAAAYVLWTRRIELGSLAMRPCWIGGIVMLAALGIRQYGLVALQESIERYAMILGFGGACLLVTGIAMTRRVFWVLAFLLLTAPLPGKVHNMIAGPLQTLATSGAVVVLELFGTTVAREGHVLTLDGAVPVAVAEACSGLRMLTAFTVVGSVLAFLAPRPLWQKVVLVVSTVPVAIVCNLVRLVVTAKLFVMVDAPTAERFFHDFAGWFMMPMAIGLMLAELWVLRWMSADAPAAAPGGAASAYP